MIKKIKKIHISNEWKTNEENNLFLERIKNNLKFSELYSFDNRNLEIEFSDKLSKWNIELSLDENIIENVITSNIFNKSRNTFLIQNFNLSFLEKNSLKVLLIDELEREINKDNLNSYNILILKCLKTLNIKTINKTSIIESYDSLLEFQRERDNNRTKNNFSSFFDFHNKNMFLKIDGTNLNESSLFLAVVKKINIEKIDIVFNIKLSNKKLYDFIDQNKELFITNDKKWNWDKTKNRINFETNKIIRNQELFSNSLMQKYKNLNVEVKCAFCKENNIKILEASHIYDVRKILENKKISKQEKFHLIHNKNNGIFLCRNHHRFFDSKMIDSEIINKLNLKNFKKIKFIYKDLDMKILDNIINKKSREFLDMK